MTNEEVTLYQRLGGYDAICAVAENLLPRLVADDLLGRFWEHRGDDGIAREKQLLIDFLAHVSGGPMYYTGRDMKTAHRGMGITEADWDRFMQHLRDALGSFNLAAAEFNDVVDFIESTKSEIVD